MSSRITSRRCKTILFIMLEGLTVSHRGEVLWNELRLQKRCTGIGWMSRSKVSFRMGIDGRLLRAKLD